MPRKKKKKLEQEAQAIPKQKKTPLKKRIGYWLTLAFAVIAAVSLIITTIFPIFF